MGVVRGGVEEVFLEGVDGYLGVAFVEGQHNVPVVVEDEPLEGGTGWEGEEEFAEIVAVVVVHEVEAQEDEEVAAEGTPLDPELSTHFGVLHQFVVGLAEGQPLPPDVGVQHDVLGRPQ